MILCLRKGFRAWRCGGAVVQTAPADSELIAVFTAASAREMFRPVSRYYRLPLLPYIS